MKEFKEFLKDIDAENWLKENCDNICESIKSDERKLLTSAEMSAYVLGASISTTIDFLKKYHEWLSRELDK